MDDNDDKVIPVKRITGLVPSPGCSTSSGMSL